MSANTETTGAPPKGYVRCSEDCGRWTNSGKCWTCCARLDGKADVYQSPDTPDWTPPIAAPAAHVERRKGQRWKSVRTMARGDTLIVTGTLMQRLDTEDGWALSNVERSDGIGAFDSCFVDSLWSNPSETMTMLADATPEPAKTCETCGSTTHEQHGLGAKSPTAQEAPKAAPVCFWFTDDEGEKIGPFATGMEADDASVTYGAWMRTQTGKPYAGPERLPKPRLAADWVEDCLGDVR